MAIVPENTGPRIAWYRARLTPWADHAAALGLTAEQVALLEEKVAAAAARHAAQIAAQSKARTATASLHAAMDELSELGSQMMQKIKATAANEGIEIYSLAMFPRPADPSPIGAPGQPTNFQVKLLSLGDIEIKWKCKNPKGSEGTMYQIQRQIGSGPFVILGSVGKKKYHDHTIPAGTAAATYRIMAFRSTRRGRPATFSVSLGVEPGLQPLFNFNPGGADKAAA